MPVTDIDVDQVLTALADGFGSALRSPVLHSPAEHGLDFDDVTFPSADGVPLEAWFIPAEGSDRLVIANHPLWFSRSGLPAHLEPWTSLGSLGGNDFEVDLTPDYRILHDAGYNVLTYDFRNFGHSGAANGGIITAGLFEARDVLGALEYVRNDPRLARMTVGLFSRCMGANATMFAMQRRPEAFADVRCMVAPQPLSPRVTLERTLALLGIPSHRIADLDERIRLRTSVRLDDMSPVPAAKHVTVPTFLYQVHDDLLTRPDDVQAMFDNIPVAEKELHWIEGSTRRWDGYAYFARNPDPMLRWFRTHMH